jgi:tRNA-specific adenosine deaminase 3
MARLFTILKRPCHAEGRSSSIASRPIPAQTLVEVSPVLLFEKKEYEQHGRHTLLDHYTYKWRDGRMALALGLGMGRSVLTLLCRCSTSTGSIFNHSSSPNVSFTLDSRSQSIQYTTSRAVAADEELCIFYGHKLWFEDIDQTQPSHLAVEEEQEYLVLPILDEDDDPVVDADSLWSQSTTKWLDGNPDEVIPVEDLPFVHIKTSPPDPIEETLESVITSRSSPPFSRQASS